MAPRDISNLVDFTLEVLHGCRWDCVGCNVDKTGQDGFIGDDDQRLMRLFDELSDDGYVLSNLAIGPTDFMSSVNTSDIMTPALTPMISKFLAITLQSTFLHDRDTLNEHAKLLNECIPPTVNVKFSIPINPKHYNNTSVASRVLDNYNYFISLLPNLRVTKLYLITNLVDYRNANTDPYNVISFAEFNARFAETYGGRHLDIVISAGRKPLNDINNRLLLRGLVDYNNALYENNLTYDTVPIINFTFGKPHEGFDRDYVYRNGNIYTPVFMGEPIVIFEDEYCIPGTVEWSARELYDFEQRQLLSALSYADKTPHCSTCEFLIPCSNRGMLQLMETLKTTDCLSPKRAFTLVRQHENYQNTQG